MIKCELFVRLEAKPGKEQARLPSVEPVDILGMKNQLA
jgi:hypothetical protein